jgi:hypothetical protein
MGLTFQQKVGALLDQGLAETREEAIAMLIDMGEGDDADDVWYPGESDSAYGPLS